MDRKSSKLFVGMDVHKQSIDLATGEAQGEVRHYRAIGGHLGSLGRVRKLGFRGRKLVLVHEARPCGFGIYRWIVSRDHEY